MYGSCESEGQLSRSNSLPAMCLEHGICLSLEAPISLRTPQPSHQTRPAACCCVCADLPVRLQVFEFMETAEFTDQCNQAFLEASGGDNKALNFTEFTKFLLELLQVQSLPFVTQFIYLSVGAPIDSAVS